MTMCFIFKKPKHAGPLRYVQQALQGALERWKVGTVNTNQFWISFRDLMPIRGLLECFFISLYGVGAWGGHNCFCLSHRDGLCGCILLATYIWTVF